MSTEGMGDLPSNEAKWGAFSDAPPVTKKGQSPLMGRLSELDVASKSPPLAVTQTAKNVDTHIQQHAYLGAHPLFPPWEE